MLREYNDNDFSFVKKIIDNSFNMNIEKIYTSSNVENLVYEDNGKVVGYLNITKDFDVVRNNMYAWINFVCVDPDCRGQGIGKKMMVSAIERCNDCKLIRLTSNPKKEVANKMYLELGFEIYGTNLFERNN
jgi:ribosomal protein S18 acetylase RimI-like enzyme